MRIIIFFIRARIIISFVKVFYYIFIRIRRFLVKIVIIEAYKTCGIYYKAYYCRAFIDNDIIVKVFRRTCY